MVTRPPVLDRPIASFRAFRERNGELCSLTSSGGSRRRWPATGIVDAACERPEPGLVPHQAPASGCGCGVYAVDSLATLRRTLAHFWFWRLLGAGHIVIAAVLVWGAPGRRVIVGELRGAPGLQYRAPHMRVLAMADSPAARRVAARDPVLVLPEVGLEAYAREHGAQLHPAAAKSRPSAETARPIATRRPVGVRLVERLGRWARPRAPRAWTIGLAVAMTLVASVHLVAFALWKALLLAVAVVGWLAPRLLCGLVWVIVDPRRLFLAVWIGVVSVVVAFVLVVTAWVWTSDLVKGVMQL